MLENGESEKPGTHRSLGWRFMEKFVQLPFVIPHLDEETARCFARGRLTADGSGVRTELQQADADGESLNNALDHIKDAKSAVEVAQLTKEALKDNSDPEDRAEIQATASGKITETLGDPEGEEMTRIVDLAINDLELNPRTIKRYFGLVRVLRNIQISSGKSGDADNDRLLVLRAAHLLMNWPEVVQWISNSPQVVTAGGKWEQTVEELGRIASRSKTPMKWSEAIRTLVSPPPHRVLHDPELYRYLRKIEENPPRLSTLYEKRFF